MICHQFKEEQEENTLWDDKLYHGFPICDGGVPLIKHLYGWNHWDRHKDAIKSKYYKEIMDEIHPEKEKGIMRFL